MSDNKINFLESALADAQELIRFIETKTSIAIAIVGGYITLLYSWTDDIIKYAPDFSWQFWVVLIIMILALLTCLFMIHVIVNPANNPAEHVVLGNETIPDPKFFIAPNRYHNSYPSFCNSKKYKLKKRYDHYLNEINAADETAIINSLSFELLKVNFIRNLKADRFNNLILMISITSLCVLIATLFLKIETNNIEVAIKNIEYIKSY